MNKLEEIFSFDNSRLSCKRIHEFSESHPQIKIHSDCQSTASTTKHARTAPTTTHTRDTDRTTTPDFDIAITTEGMSINIIIPNTTTLANTTIDIGYGDYKISIIASSGVVIVIVVVVILICSLWKYSKKMKAQTTIRKGAMEMTIRSNTTGGSRHTPRNRARGCHVDTPVPQPPSPRRGGSLSSLTTSEEEVYSQITTNNSISQGTRSKTQQRQQKNVINMTHPHNL